MEVRVSGVCFCLLAADNGKLFGVEMSLGESSSSTSSAFSLPSSLVSSSLIAQESRLGMKKMQGFPRAPLHTRLVNFLHRVVSFILPNPNICCLTSVSNVYRTLLSGLGHAFPAVLTGTRYWFLLKVFILSITNLGLPKG